ncbi:radical SAM protein [Candidatus Saccharibacteria bacterium]|nr:radical SAM protein [Candidatus Saccharibacteria bacterium]MCL1962747.1 radical SAM protein [Candidatus Saccharibacteria bacterium]
MANYNHATETTEASESDHKPTIAMYFGDGLSCEEGDRALILLKEMLIDKGVNVARDSDAPVENILFAGCARTGTIVENRLHWLGEAVQNNQKLGGKLLNVIITECLAGLDERFAGGGVSIPDYVRRVANLPPEVKLHLVDVGRLGEDILPIIMPDAEVKEEDHISRFGIELTKDIMRKARKNPEKNPFQEFMPVIIQSGCENQCDYCVRNYAHRPSESSPDYDKLVNHIRDNKERTGSLVLQLQGENIGLFGVDTDGRQRLPDLIRDTDQMGFVRGDLYNIAPQQFTPEVVDAIRETNIYDGARINLDIPSERMEQYIHGRAGQRQKIAEGLARIREIHPNFACRSTCMIGLPGETMEDLDEMLQFCADNDIIMDRFCPYQGHESLPTAKLPDQIPDDKKVHRVQYATEKSMAMIKEKFERDLKFKDVEYTVSAVVYDEKIGFTCYTLVSPWGSVWTNFYDETARKLNVGDKIMCSPWLISVRQEGTAGYAAGTASIIKASILAFPNECHDTEEKSQAYVDRFEKAYGRNQPEEPNESGA